MERYQGFENRQVTWDKFRSVLPAELEVSDPIGGNAYEFLWQRHLAGLDQHGNTIRELPVLPYALGRLGTSDVQVAMSHLN